MKGKLLPSDCVRRHVNSKYLTHSKCPLTCPFQASFCLVFCLRLPKQVSHSTHVGEGTAPVVAQPLCSTRIIRSACRNHQPCTLSNTDQYRNYCTRASSAQPILFLNMPDLEQPRTNFRLRENVGADHSGEERQRFGFGSRKFGHDHNDIAPRYFDDVISKSAIIEDKFNRDGTLGARRAALLHPKKDLEMTSLSTRSLLLTSLEDKRRKRYEGTDCAIDFNFSRRRSLATPVPPPPTKQKMIVARTYLYTCSRCRKSYDDFRKFRKHMSTRHGTQKHTVSTKGAHRCRFCPNRFMTEADLNRHIVQHFKCPRCRLQLYSERTLQRHMTGCGTRRR